LSKGTRYVVTSSVRRCTAWSVARDAPLFFILLLHFAGPGRKTCHYKPLSRIELQLLGMQISFCFSGFLT